MISAHKYCWQLSQQWLDVFTVSELIVKKAILIDLNLMGYCLIADRVLTFLLSYLKTKNILKGIRAKTRNNLYSQQVFRILKTNRLN